MNKFTLLRAFVTEIGDRDYEIEDQDRYLMSLIRCLKEDSREPLHQKLHQRHYKCPRKGLGCISVSFISSFLTTINPLLTNTYNAYCSDF